MRISIITPTFNAASTLGEALATAAFAGERGIEHLLIDAASGDNTLGVARSFPRVRIFSESDEGIYDGMNKGAGMAVGEWLLFLQADDWLPEGTLQSYEEAIDAFPDAEIICGCAEAVRRAGEGWSEVWRVSDPLARRLNPSNIALGEPMLNARLIRREVFLRLGGFSLAYPLASDRDFLLRAARAGIAQVEISADTYRYRWHPGSSTMTEGNAMTGQLSAENLAIARSHLQGGVGGECKEALRTWHTRLTVQAAMNALESLNPAFFRSLLEGQKVDPLWGAAFLSELLGSIPGFIARGCRTRSQLHSP